MEIEKRYELIGDIPLDLVQSKIYIEQVYSSIADTNGTPDVRIRKVEENGDFHYYHTVKYKTDDKNSRVEIEQPISEELYNKIYKLIDKIPVRKYRYIIPIGNNLFAEIDKFLDKDITIVEVEFPNTDIMNDFSKSEKPFFIGKEILNKQTFSTQIFSQINNDVIIKFY